MVNAVFSISKSTILPGSLWVLAEFLLLSTDSLLCLIPRYQTDTISVHQAKVLPTAFFRFPVTKGSLAVRLCTSHHRDHYLLDFAHAWRAYMWKTRLQVEQQPGFPYSESLISLGIKDFVMWI